MLSSQSPDGGHESTGYDAYLAFLTQYVCPFHFHAFAFVCCRLLRSGSRLLSVCVRCRFPGPTSLGSHTHFEFHPIRTASIGSPLPTPMSSPLLACPSNHSMPYVLFATAYSSAHSFKFLFYFSMCARATPGCVQTNFRDECGLKQSSYLN
jgi:hypothetical protein